MLEIEQEAASRDRAGGDRLKERLAAVLLDSAGKCPMMLFGFLVRFGEGRQEHHDLMRRRLGFLDIDKGKSFESTEGT